MQESHGANLIQIANAENPKARGAQGVSLSGRPKLYRLKRKIFDFFNTGGGYKISSVAIDLHFTIWKLRHPGAKFSDYYAGSIAAKLNRGKTHKTLGKYTFLSSSFTAGPIEHDLISQKTRGANHFSAALRYGLRPEHTCIDFGCGSLRVGQHIIEYLKPGCYWGLDVISYFYESGKALLPPDLVNQKRPELHVIGPDVLAAARDSAPDFIVSFAVLKHVPPVELDGYFQNITRMMAPNSKAIVTFSESKCTTRTGAKIWNYCKEEIVASLRRQRLGLKCTISPYNEKAKSSGLPHTSVLLIEQVDALLS